MSLWAAQPPRHTMNDAARGRFMLHEPKTENCPDSKGPAHYTPRRIDYRRTDNGSVRLHTVEPGRSERDLTLSDGTDVRHLLPAGPGSYEPPDLWAGCRSPGQLLPVSPATPQRANSRSPGALPTPRGASPSPARYSPPVGSRAKLQSSSIVRTSSPEAVGPGTYAPKLPHSSRGARFSTMKRSSNQPLPRPPPLSPEELAQLTPVGGGKPGGFEASVVRGSPRRPTGRVLEKKGPTISTTPRKFNLANPNSFTYRHKDADYAVPPPGWYAVRDESTSRHGTRASGGAFSVSPRRIDLARRTAAPGPGTYDLGVGSPP